MMGIESCAQEYELGPMLCRYSLKRTGEMLQIGLARCAVGKGNIARCAESPPTAGFIPLAGTRVERPTMDRKKSDLFALPENILGSVAVVDVPVDN